MNRQFRGVILLLITTMLWGCSFVAQRTSVDAVDAFTFNTGRMCSAFLTLLIIVLVRNLMLRGRSGQGRQGDLAGPGVAAGRGFFVSKDRRTLLIGGILCGLALAIGIDCMQLGIMTTSAGKTGFITSVYIVEVPIIGLLIGQRPRKILWLCVALALAGLWLLAVQPGTSMMLQKGDLILLFGSIFFALQILFVDHYVEQVDPLELSLVQFAVGAVINPVCMVLLEDPSWPAFVGELAPMLYAGVLSSAVGFTLAAYAQKDVDPTVASLLMSLEGVFAVLGAWVLIHEHLSPRELAGCALMFAAIVITQLPQRKPIEGGEANETDNP